MSLNPVEKRGGIALEWFLTEPSRGSLKKTVFFLRSRKQVPKTSSEKHISCHCLSQHREPSRALCHSDCHQAWFVPVLCRAAGGAERSSARLGTHSTVTRRHLPTALYSALLKDLAGFPSADVLRVVVVGRRFQ